MRRSQCTAGRPGMTCFGAIRLVCEGRGKNRQLTKWGKTDSGSCQHHPRQHGATPVPERIALADLADLEERESGSHERDVREVHRRPATTCFGAKRPVRGVKDVTLTTCLWRGRA